MNITFERVSKYFDRAKTLQDVDFQIEDGEFFTLLGPSGCGKTTLLRTIAGFYKQEEGNIYFGDRLMNGVPAHRRNIGMVFQNYAIFPHMSVFDNVAYGLKARRVNKAETERRVMEALELVELAHLRGRSPSEMSGGQQQRIALARAVVIRPALLLMDEPLSNLDAKLRIKMRSDIRALQQELGITTIYVTHDQEEALAVSDRIAVMHGGVVQQIGSPQDIYMYPENRIVANFIGTSNFLEAEVSGYDAATGGALLRLPPDQAFRLTLAKAYEGKALLSIRPENVNISGELTRDGQFRGQVQQGSFLGGKVHYTVHIGNGRMIEVERHLTERHELFKAHQGVYLDFQLERAILYDAKGEEVLGHGSTRATRIVV
ncbi:ABC transporter ATP-binding protein [Paenibacillus glycinis]|uniref:ATP-binding cassette domain-containing protein n=1 Tax=Paenibacillus glycinis TaxID=2697035 RepID=A0ABW9XNC0_9BACL|nr:ABC transporter ATP-binding protein [Paenibacillus glycinis]NBD24143.1 ATP-binding cassette domain-containing protein [Paenibacillus glycinis]